MPDSLKIWGTEYTGVAGFIAKDSSNNEYTYTRPSGTVSITENGVVDVVAYASASIDVDRTGGHVVQDGSSIAIPSNEVDSGFSLNDWISGDEPSGDIVYTSDKKPKDQALAYAKAIGALTIEKNIEISSYFAQGSSVTSVSAPLVTKANWYAFTGCTSLVSISFPKLTDIPRSMFENCRFSVAAFPALTGNGGVGAYALRSNSVLIAADFGSPKNLAAQAFQSDTSLVTVILRKDTIVTLDNVSVFQSTPFASGGTGGTIYIPKSLYDCLGDGTSSDYKAATNWSTMDGYGTITWACIEGSYYETHYADGTEIPST